jgi:hypothetical protein
MQPINIGTFSSSYYAITSISKVGLYRALIETPSSKYNPNGKFDEIWFYAGDSFVEFMIYYMPREIDHYSSIKIAINNNLIMPKMYLSTENNLVYVPVQTFIDRFLLNQHPATGWLLFNQDLWNHA